MTNFSPESVPTNSFLLSAESLLFPDFSFCRNPLGATVSVELAGVVGCIERVESRLAERSDSGKDVGFGGSLRRGCPRSAFGVMGYSGSSVTVDGDGIYTSSGSISSESCNEGVVVTETIVSKEVRLRRRG